MILQFDRLEGRYLQDLVGPVFDAGYIQGIMPPLAPADIWYGQGTPSRTPFLLQPPAPNPPPAQPPVQPPVIPIDPMDPLSPPLDAVLDQC